MSENKQETVNKMRELSIEGCEIIGEGAVGKVYRLDDETIIKVFAPGIPFEVVQEEKNIARNALVSGVPTAISFDVVKVGKSYGAVYEMLKAKTLSAFIKEHPERAAEMGRRMGHLLKELHKTAVDTNKFVNVCNLFKERVLRMEKYLSKEETDKLITVYECLGTCKTIVHGDFHPKNIMYTEENDELLFIDLADMGYGHPLIDLGGTCLVMDIFGRFTPERVPHYIGIDYKTSITVWENLIYEYFNGDNIEEAKILADIYGKAKFTLFPVIIPGMSEKDAMGFLMGSRSGGFLNKDYDITPALKCKLEF
ncbi:MAG: phosphotransferase [Firmicutes bacterium]|nr:phosphotransferase [Bacillota bacterium]